MNSRRHFLKKLTSAALAFPSVVSVAAPGTFQISSFSADVTVPVGHGMMGGLWQAKSIADPLLARGCVLLGGDKPVVFVSVDWCEIRNDAYERWRTVLAEAAGTDPARVLVTSIHQHEAPVVDLSAEKILRERQLSGSICDLDFHEVAVQRVAKVLRDSLPKARRVTHLGTGQGKVERLASNRRYVMPDGSMRFDRGSATKNIFAIEADEGIIDPFCKCLSFWDGDTPLAALSSYAIHPMSYYRTGEVSSDFPGLARSQRQKDLPGVFQIYASGCSGNVTAGKYNDGTRANRQILADRLHAGMKLAWENTKRQPLTKLDFRKSEVIFPPRPEAEFTIAALEKKLTPETKVWDQCLAAMGLSWRRRLDAGKPVDIPLLDFGPAQLLLLPGEAYVEFQLAAQKLRPDSFVMTLGYGESATGYIPTEKHRQENDTNLHDWYWVGPGAEEQLLAVIRKVLAVR
ncbi:MAG: Alpha/beta hydrolase family protein [Verrucomicrobia bacterium]|nr:Alpha/beta hydrolase family protein [Verrucomicrobiota bacterium]